MLNGGRKAKRVIKSLRLGEISLVDEGDNPGAHVLIVKARGAGARARSELDGFRSEIANGEIEAMSLEAIQKRLDEIETNLTEVEKARDDALAEVDVLKAANAKALKDLEDAKDGGKDDGKEDAEGNLKKNREEDIFKGLDPKLRERFEQVEKRASDAEAEIAKARDAALTDAEIAKAKELGLDKPEDVGAALVRVRKGTTTEADADLFVGILKQAKTVAETGSNLFKHIGGSGGAALGDEETQLDLKAKDIAKAKNVDYHTAYAEACDSNPDLYGAIVAKNRAKRS